VSGRRVGIVGTGAMGRPVVARLVAAGHHVAAYARRGEARDELAAGGIEVVASLADLGRDRDVVVIYVYSDEEARQVALDDGLVDALAPGAVVVIHTTGSPRTAEAIAARGVAVVDAPGSGGPAQVAAGTLTLFVGGDVEHVERCRPVFAAYAANVVHFGPLGSGQKVKLVNNLLFAAHLQLALEAARIAEVFDIDVHELTKTLHACSGASYAIDLVAAMGSADALVQAAGPFVRKDVLVARAVAAELGAPLGTMDGATRPFVEP